MSDSHDEGVGDLTDRATGGARKLADLVRGRYATRLGVALLGAVALLLVLGLVVQTVTATEVRQDARQNLETSAVTQAENVNEWVQGNKRQVRTISRLPTLSADDHERISSELADLVEHGHVSDEVVAIHVIDRDEKQIISSSNPEKFVGKSPAEMDEPFVPKIQEGFSDPDEVYVSRPFQLPIVDFPVVAMLSPVPGENRVVGFMINPTGKVATLGEGGETRVQPMEGAHTHVVSSDGEAVAAPGNETHDEQAKDRAVANALNGDTGVVVMDDESLMGYASIGSNDWVVLTHVQREEAFGMIGIVRTGIGAMVLVALLTLAIVGVTIGRSTATALRSLAADARELGEGDLDVEFDVDRRDEIGTLATSMGEMRDSLREQIAEAQQARTEAERRRQEAEQFNHHLEQKATEYGTALEAVAEGDLTQRVEPSSESEAMASVGTSINRAVEDLSGALAEVTAFAGTVADTSHAVDASAEDVQRASQEASDAVQEIRDGAVRQSEMLEDVASEMESLSASAQQAASATDSLAKTSERAAEAGEQGRDAARAAIEEMNEVESQTEQAVQRIETLDEEMAVIGEVVELIQDIAEQTNILALNASIEAARAGKTGQGFAVVAEEVKDLAEETREAAADVEQRLEDIQEQTDATVEDIQATRERLTAGIDTVEEAIGSLTEITGHVEDTDEGVQEISEATAEQARTAQSVVAMVDELTAIGAQTTDEAERVAAAAEEQTATLSEVSDSANDLSTRASELQSLLADFDVDGSADLKRSTELGLGSPAED